MPQYAVIGRHEANGCPMNSKGAREAATRAYGGAEQLMKQKNVRILSDLHLDPNHLAFMLFEAPSAEAVRDVLMDGGFTGYLDVSLYLVTPIPEVLKKAGTAPTYYP